ADLASLLERLWRQQSVARIPDVNWSHRLALEDTPGMVGLDRPWAADHLDVHDEHVGAHSDRSRQFREQDESRSVGFGTAARSLIPSPRRSNLYAPAFLQDAPPRGEALCQKCARLAGKLVFVLQLNKCKNPAGLSPTRRGPHRFVDA